LGQVNKTGIAVFQDIIDQFLDDPENDQFVICGESLFIIVETGTGIEVTGSADFLEGIINGRFKAKVLQGRRHQAMGDITDKLYGIINVLGIVYLRAGGRIASEVSSR
jgi:hypothetical protein